MSSRSSQTGEVPPRVRVAMRFVSLCADMRAPVEGDDEMSWPVPPREVRLTEVAALRLLRCYFNQRSDDETEDRQ